MKKLFLTSLLTSLLAVSLQAKNETDTFRIDTIENKGNGCELMQYPSDGMNAVIFKVKDKNICKKVKTGKSYKITYANLKEYGEESVIADLVKIKF